MKQAMAGLALAFAIVGTAGCGGSQKPATPKGPTCADVAANVSKEMMAAGAQSGMDMTAFAKIASDAVAARCPADAWSAEAIACLATATAEQMDACAEKLTPEQNRKLEEETKSRAEALPEADREMMMKGSPSSEEPAPAGAPAPSDPCGGGE